MAYHGERECQFGCKLGNDLSVGCINPHPIWVKIWKLKVPAKVKTFLLCIMKYTIPCRSVSADRDIRFNLKCPVCKGGAADVKHLMSLCPREKLIWRDLGLGLQTQKACEVGLVGRAGQAEYLIHCYAIHGCHRQMLGHLSLSTNREAKVYLQICRPFNCLACSSWGPKTTYTLYFFHDNSRQHSFMADEPSTYLVQSLLTCDNSEGGPLFLLGEWRC
jgi:hypothetical protein